MNKKLQSKNNGNTSNASYFTHYQKIIREFFKNKTNKVLVILFLFALVIFFSLLKNAIIIFFLIVLAWITKFYQRYITAPFGFDFSLMVCVLTAYTYGGIIGAFSGVVSLFLSTMWGGRFTPNIFFGFFLFILIAFITPNFTFMSISTLGIMITIFYDLVQLFMLVTVFGGKIEKGLIFVGTNFLFNLWAFLIIAPKILSIM